MVGQVLCNISFNNFLFFLCNIAIQSFANVYTVSSFAKTVNNLVSILNSSSDCTTKWFRYYSMTGKPGKFQAIWLEKRNSDLLLTKKIKIDKENIVPVSNGILCKAAPTRTRTFRKNGPRTFRKNRPYTKMHCMS